jgi:hypothetical protein
MKKDKYEAELKHLYGIAIKQEDVRNALDILERGREFGIDDMERKENE